ncbi:MAG: hypothetical protein JWN01_55 [Patescibacteria group bacterium]|nr:hypothetical protein [Patescibacteria group bacterium]
MALIRIDPRISRPVHKGSNRALPGPKSVELDACPKGVEGEAAEGLGERVKASLFEGRQIGFVCLIPEGGAVTDMHQEQIAVQANLSERAGKGAGQMDILAWERFGGYALLGAEFFLKGFSSLGGSFQSWPEQDFAGGTGGR